MYVTKTDSQRTNGYQWEVRRAEGQAGVGVRDCIWSHHFMANRWGNSGNGERQFFGLQNHCRW